MVSCVGSGKRMGKGLGQKVLSSPSSGSPCPSPNPGPNNHWSTFCYIRFVLFQSFVLGESYRIPSLLYMPSFTSIFLKFTLHASVGFSSLLKLSSIPLHGYAILYLSIDLFMGIWTVSGSGLQLQSCCEHCCSSISAVLCFHFSGAKE